MFDIWNGTVVEQNQRLELECAGTPGLAYIYSNTMSYDFDVSIELTSYSGVGEGEDTYIEFGVTGAEVNNISFFLLE